MIRLLHRKEINTHAWNERVRTGDFGQVFFMTWYLDACTGGDWFALIDGQYESIMPLASRDKLGIDYLYQPFFLRHMGVISGKETDESQRLKFLEAIPERFKFQDFCLHEGHRVLPEDCVSEERQYQKLSFHAEYPEIELGYSDNLRRVLRKTRKTAFKIRDQYNPEVLVDQFKKHQPDLAKTFRQQDYQRLTELMRAASSYATIRCLSISHPDGSIHAGAFFIEACGRLLYLKGFSTPEGKKSGAMHHLFDSVIKEHAGTGLILDFGGSSVKSVSRFYHHFGSSDCLYLRLRANRLPKAIRWLKY
ncbi:MAG: hypothetical protein ACKOQY_09285 [Bacteroidota bacterium]